MAKRNSPIGTVECPHKGCTEACNVFRFKERGETEKSVANRRFAGRLYGRCPKHGRFGGEPGETETQEYILNNATMTSPSSPAAAPATAPAVFVNSPAKSQTPPATVRRRSPATSPAAPATAPAIKPDGWSWPWE